MRGALSKIGDWSLVIGHWSLVIGLVIGHWSLVPPSPPPSFPLLLPPSPSPLPELHPQELSLVDIPVLMTLLDERPSGKLCVSYQKQTMVDAVDEILATTQRIPNLDITKVIHTLPLFSVSA